MINDANNVEKRGSGRAIAEKKLETENKTFSTSG